MELLVMVAAGQIAVVGLLFRWLHTQTRDNKQEMVTMKERTYSKDDTDKLIDLKLRPIEVQLTNIQDDLKEVKSMLTKFLHEKV